MRKRKYFYGACHYCICTACSQFNCPFKHRLYQECYGCRERGNNVPRLDCDFFSHYLKKHHFKFKRLNQPIEKNFGTYLLITQNNVFVGKYEEMISLSKRLGGKVKKFNIISNFFET